MLLPKLMIYMLCGFKTEKFNIKGICAAPFCKPSGSESHEGGMLKSYYEICLLLTLLKREDLKAITFKGSDAYMEAENIPIESDAADFISKTANEYTTIKGQTVKRLL